MIVRVSVDLGESPETLESLAGELFELDDELGLGDDIGAVIVDTLESVSGDYAEN